MDDGAKILAEIEGKDNASRRCPKHGDVTLSWKSMPSPVSAVDQPDLFRRRSYDPKMIAILLALLSDMMLPREGRKGFWNELSTSSILMIDKLGVNYRKVQGHTLRVLRRTHETTLTMHNTN